MKYIAYLLRRPRLYHFFLTGAAFQKEFDSTRMYVFFLHILKMSFPKALKDEGQSITLINLFLPVILMLLLGGAVVLPHSSRFSGVILTLG